MGDLRRRILGMQDLRSERVVIPEWDDVELEVRSMTGLQRAKLMDSAVGEDGAVDGHVLQAMVIIETTYDPTTGQPVFESTDRDALRGKNASALDALGRVALRLSGLGKDAADAAKNGFGANGGSITGSPATPDEPSASS